MSDGDDGLKASYAHCRRINAAHGKTFYLATLLLPPEKRPYVHALYAFARDLDDRIDVAGDLTEATWDDAALVDPRIRPALEDTVSRWQIPRSYFADFIQSMRMDLTIMRYPTYDDLAKYMWGSAAVVGLQMLPILGRASESIGWEQIEPHAIDLGYAFQLTNFIRDVGEDLHRGRIYLPGEDLAAFGVTPERLARGIADGPIRALLAHEIERARGLYRAAAQGVALVHPTSRHCLRVAITLYGEILEAVERRDYDVFSRRARVGLRRRLVVGLSGWAGAALTRAALTRSNASPPAGPSSSSSSA